MFGQDRVRRAGSHRAERKRCVRRATAASLVPTVIEISLAQARRSREDGDVLTGTFWTRLNETNERNVHFDIIFVLDLQLDRVTLPEIRWRRVSDIDRELNDSWHNTAVTRVRERRAR